MVHMFQVNNHDITYNEQGYLTYKDRWLVLALNIDLDWLQEHVTNITHFTVYAATSLPNEYIEVNNVTNIPNSCDKFYATLTHFP